MTDVASRPRPEDFGLSGEALERIPSLFIAPRRGLLCTATLTSLAVAAVVILGWTSGSAATGLFLGVLFFVASMILLLPLTMGCVCLAGKLEESLRSARDPAFRACERYRAALAEFAADKKGQTEMAQLALMRNTSFSKLCAHASTMLGSGAAVEELDRPTTGADILLRHADCTILVRCEAGPDPVQANVARELLMARLDLGADEAVLVAPAGGTDALNLYIKKHPLRLLDGPALVSGARWGHSPVLTL